MAKKEVRYIHTSEHSVTLNAGDVQYAHALPSSAGLYMIRNTGTDRPFYVGTSVNLQQRFAVRAEAMREMGFRQAELGTISIHIIKFKYNEVFTSVTDTGKLRNTNIDVERILIRTLIKKGNTSVRNVSKTELYKNLSGWDLDIEFDSFPMLFLVHGLDKGFTLRANRCI